MSLLICPKMDVATKDGPSDSRTISPLEHDPLTCPKTFDYFHSSMNVPQNRSLVPHLGFLHVFTLIPPMEILLLQNVNTIFSFVRTITLFQPHM
jgi:hypothetical protein